MVASEMKTNTIPSSTASRCVVAQLAVAFQHAAAAIASATAAPTKPAKMRLNTMDSKEGSIENERDKYTAYT